MKRYLLIGRSSDGKSHIIKDFDYYHELRIGITKAKFKRLYMIFDLKDNSIQYDNLSFHELDDIIKDYRDINYNRTWDNEK